MEQMTIPDPTTITGTESLPPTSDPAAFIENAYFEKKRGKIEKKPCNTNRASQLGDPCERYLVLLRTNWKQETLHGVRLQCIFDEGIHQEEALIADLLAAKIRIYHSEVSLDYPEYQITGHIDGTIRWGDVYIPVENKSVHPIIWDKIKTLDDMKNHKSWIVQKWPAQITLYMLMHNSEIGLLILKNKSTGEIKVLNVPLDYELGESLLEKAERINKHVKDGTLPDPIEWCNRCERCGFFPHLCAPNIERTGAEIMDDPDLEADLERWDELKAAVLEHKELDESIKNRVKGRTGFCGEWEIGGKNVQVKGNPNPKPREPYSYWKPNIRKIA